MHLRMIHAWGRVVPLLVAAALVCGSACGKSQTSPSPVSATVTTLTIVGPGSIEPGATARYAATARFTDGSTSDVTAEATWHSTRPDIVELGPNGVAVARSRGETEIRAQYQALSLPLGVMVLEDGTFKLSGRVTDTETGGNIHLAAIEVQDGVGAGLHATTDNAGRYVLHGVAGSVRLTVSADGMMGRTESIAVNGATVLDVVLTPLAAAADLSGRWTLTVTAPDCGNLPELARSRTFVASIGQAGSQLVALLSSSSVRVADPLQGRILGSAIAVTIPYWSGQGVDFDYYALLDAIEPRGLLGIWGTIQATVDGQAVNGVLEGGLHYFQNTVTFGAHVGCEGRPAVVRLRRE